VLFVALGCLLLVLDFPVFRRAYLLFMLPVTVVSLLVPVPSLTPAAPALSGSEKVSMFAADLDVDSNTTSGTDRVLISQMGIDVWLRHPWFGVGPRAYDDYVYTRFDEELPGVNKYDANGAINAKNENIWIEFLAECGVLFTAGFALVLGRALWVRRLAFADSLHLGAWIALILYFGVSGQVSQNGLLTMTYAVLGIFFYASGATRDTRAPRGPGNDRVPRILRGGTPRRHSGKSP
jgi:O-antigen ligase